MKEFKFNVEGMMCTGCENRVKTAISKIHGVQEVSAHHETGIVEVKADENVDEEIIKNMIIDLDYEVK